MNNLQSNPTSEKRRVRSYKIKDTDYVTAFDQAGKNNGHIANFIENILIAYGSGFEIKAVDKSTGKTIPVNLLTDDVRQKLKSFKKRG